MNYKVGDLVKRKRMGNEKRIGIVVGVHEFDVSGLRAWEQGVLICWGDYGAFWTPVRNLEILNES
jgi:hypothetical protein